MIKILFKYCDLILEFILREATYNKLRNRSFEQIFVFDLDNTIVNTWDGYNYENGAPKFISFFSIYKNAKAYPKMISLVNSINSTDNIVIFLSARNSIFFRSTKIWLENHLKIDNYNLILVNSASRKLGILNSLSKMGKVNYYDDLSYGHEYGKIIFYEKIITQIKALPICFFDFEYISNYNSTNNIRRDVKRNE
jgi:hypothetical protein